MSKTKILDGNELSSGIYEELESRVERLDGSPSLEIIYIGSNDSSESYIKHKRKKAAELGITAEVSSFTADVEPRAVYDRIVELNSSSEVEGIIVQLPVPDKFDPQKLLSAVDPAKDVDGLHPVNFGRLMSNRDPLYLPPTPRGILTMLESLKVDLSGTEVVLVGMGRLVGRPLSQLLLNRDATVICIHEETRFPRELIQRGEVVVTGAGVPELIGADDISEGAVVIDAGISRRDGELVGDVVFEEVKEKAAAITPVPGGVGPMTVVSLLSNVVKAREKQQ